MRISWKTKKIVKTTLYFTQQIRQIPGRLQSADQEEPIELTIEMAYALGLDGLIL